MNHLFGIFISALLHIGAFFLLFTFLFSKPDITPEQQPKEIPLKLSMFVPAPEPEPVVIPQPAPEPVIEEIKQTPPPEPEPEIISEPEPKPIPVVKTIKKEMKKEKPKPVKKTPKVKPKPKAKPKPKKKPKPKPRPKPKAQPKKQVVKKPPPPVRQARPAPTPARPKAVPQRQTIPQPASRPAPKAQPRQAPAAASGPAANAYQTAVRKAILAQKKYPARARRSGQQGTVVVAFTILRNGALQNIRVTKSSGHARLDQAAIKAVQKINGRVPIPANLNRASWNFSVPLRYSLN